MTDPYEERIARILGEMHHPAWTEHRRKSGPVPEGVDRFDWYEEVVHPSPGADGSTMTTFTGEDGNLAMRPLTWREVVAEVAPLVRAEERPTVDLPDLDYEATDYTGLRIEISDGFMGETGDLVREHAKAVLALRRLTS